MKKSNFKKKAPRTVSFSKGFLSQRKSLNKKGVTEVMLVLIISGIAVALLFVGVFLSYEAFSEDLGIDFKKSQLIARPHYSTPSKIIITKVYREDVDKQTCEQHCVSVHTDIPLQNSCKNDCEQYVDGLNYSRWYVFFEYQGAVASKLTLHVFEETIRTDQHVLADVVKDTTDSLLVYGNDGMFTFTKVKEEPCQGNLTITFIADQDQNAEVYYLGVKEPYFHENDFCVSPAPRDVNVSINELDLDANNDGTLGDIITDISITGSEVVELCPKANAIIAMTNKSGEEIPLPSCTFEIDTNRSNAPGGWYDEAWEYRVKFNLSNDAGEEITVPELGVINLDFSSAKDYYNISDCAKEIVITRTYDGAPKLLSRVTSTSTVDGFCRRAKVEFVVNVSDTNDGELPFETGNVLTFFAYFGNTDSTVDESTDDAGVIAYYPKYTICPTGCDYDFSGGIFTNTSTDRDTINNYLTLIETCCESAHTQGLC